MTKKYIGVKFGDEVYVDDGEKRVKLTPQLGVVPNATGFSWGNSMTGGQLLAYAILFDAVGYDDAKRFRTRFVHRVIKSLPKDSGWTLSLDDVMKEVNEMRSVEKLTAPERARIAQQPAPRESYNAPGVVWDNAHDTPKD